MDKTERIRLKSLAKEQIKGSIGTMFLILLAVYVLVFAASWVTSFAGGVGGYIIGPALGIGIVMIYLNMAKGVKPHFSDVFNGFDLFSKSLLLQLLTEIFVFLWSLLFIVPGIIKSIAYSAAPYILAENPQKNVREILKESENLMMGHKKDYFILTMSFLPWIFLSALTFGIGLIYVVPYMDMTMTNFYLSIKPVETEQYFYEEKVN